MIVKIRKPCIHQVYDGHRDPDDRFCQGEEFDIDMDFVLLRQAAMASHPPARRYLLKLSDMFKSIVVEENFHR